MNRCSVFRWRNPSLLHQCAIFLFLLAVVAISPVALAQVRSFPPNILRGTLEIVQPPIARMDGKEVRLAPAARIRNTQNMIVMSGALVGQRHTVNYTRDASGLLRDVWILTEAEAELKVPSADPPGYRFESQIDPTVRDDGKIPYNRLPGLYGQ